jgi:hypothetical protein
MKTVCSTSFPVPYFNKPFTSAGLWDFCDMNKNNYCSIEYALTVF